MDVAIWTAIITGGLSLIGVILTNSASNRKLINNIDKSQALMDAKVEKALAVSDTKIEELTREVRSHNDFAQRIPVIDEQIKSIKRRLDEIEHNK